MFTGYYLYTYTLLQSAGDNAKLEISVSGNGELSCLQFYYHMYAVIDNLMGTLRVFSGNTVVFTISGNHGDIWIKAERIIYLNKTVSLVDILYPLHVFSLEDHTGKLKAAYNTSPLRSLRKYSAIAAITLQQLLS